jgi:hypothetical protein
MSKTLKYVKDFDFSSAGKTVGLCGGGMVKKGYAEGGKADMAQDKAMVKAAVHKHERALHKGEPLTKLAKGGVAKFAGEKSQTAGVKAPAAPPEMIRDASRLGIQGNKNPSIARRRMPVAPAQPMIQPFAKGGHSPNAGMSKIPKVMGEFKAGDLHSGSKKGPVVTNPKQATAIALSEARAVKKK